MPPQNLSWSIFGRPIKPVAFALAISMLIISFSAYQDFGVLGKSKWADGLALVAVLDAVFLTFAWVRSSQLYAEWGLLLAFAVWDVRFWLIVFVSSNPISTEGLWLAACWSIVAGGSYLLEKTDPGGRHHRRGS